MEKNGLIYREAMASDARMKRIVVSEKALQYKDMVIADITALEEELTANAEVPLKLPTNILSTIL